MATSGGPASGGERSQPGGAFVSWTRADTDRDGPLGGLVERLVARGVPVWIDDGQIATFDPIPDRIRQGLAQARVLLAWYSLGYPTRRACREELTLALLAAHRHGQPDRVLVVNPEKDSKHLLEAPLLNTRFAGQQDLHDLDGLADRIAERVTAQPTPLGALPAAGRVNWHGAQAWQDGSRRFVGRLHELWTLHDMLCRTTELVAGQAGRALALVSGFGGVGKSLLAAEYARLFASSYPGGVVWLSALGNDSTGSAPGPEQSQSAAASAYAELAGSWLRLDVQDLDPRALREAVRAELNRRGEQVLWVVDDLPSGLDAAGLSAWRCPSPVTHELITTRDRTHSSPPTHELGVLGAEDALALLLQGHDWPAAEREQARLLDRGSDDVLAAQPVTGKLHQHSRCVVLQRPSNQERVEEFAVRRTREPPPEARQHHRSMIASGAAFPSAVGAKQPNCIRGGKPQPACETTQHGSRTRAQIVRDPTQPRQHGQLDRSSQPVLYAHVRREPAEIIAGQREERNQILVVDLVRPATQPRELGVGKKPNRHEARYPRPSTPDKTTGAALASAPVGGSVYGTH